MEKTKLVRMLIIGVLAILLIIQFFRTDKTNPQLNAETDFRKVEQVPEEIAVLIEKACYDCHSNETVYPWYAGIAPFSWIIKSHVTEGRENMNFSEWAKYQPGKRGHFLDECSEVIEKGEMPLKQYTLLHPVAKFNTEEKAILVKWFTRE